MLSGKKVISRKGAKAPRRTQKFCVFLCAFAGEVFFRASVLAASVQLHGASPWHPILIEAARCDSRCSRVVIQLSPARTVLAGTWWAHVAPDTTVNVALIEVISRGDDLTRSRIVIESFPPRTIRATARCARVAPDPSVVVQLIKLSGGGHDRYSPRIVVESLPPRTRVAATWCSRETPDRSIRVKLEDLVCRRDDVLRIWIIVQELPTRARAGSTGFSGVTPDLPVVVQLNQADRCSSNCDCPRISIEFLPSRTIRSTAAWRTCVTPDFPVIVKLEQLHSGRGNRLSTRIVIQ